MRKWLGPALVFFVACVWLNQSVGLRAWERIRQGVFGDPSAHLADTLRYPFIFLYRRSADEAMYYRTAAQILGEDYDHDVGSLHSRGRVTGAEAFDDPPPPSDGHWHMPWAEVRLEYPPPVLPFLLLPAIGTQTFEGYARSFGLLMGLCLFASIYLAIDVFRRTDPDPAQSNRRWWLAVALLLAEGALAIQRLDAVVGLLLVAAIRGAVRRRPAELGFWGGLAGACKVVPLLVLPVMVAADWTFWRTRLKPLAAWTAAALVLGFAPMFLASSEAPRTFLHYHGARGLQVESTLAVLLGAVRLALGTTHPATISYGSFNLDGAVPDLLARLTTPLTLAAIAMLAAIAWQADARQRGEPVVSEPARVERIVGAAIAATIALWICGKVFSPQYLTWGIPLVLAVPGRRGLRAIALAGVALVLTQLYYRGYYDHVVEQDPAGVVTLLLRQGVLVALLFVVAPHARLRGRASRVAPAA